MFKWWAAKNLQDSEQGWFPVKLLTLFGSPFSNQNMLMLGPFDTEEEAEKNAALLSTEVTLYSQEEGTYHETFDGLLRAMHRQGTLEVGAIYYKSKAEIEELEDFVSAEDILKVLDDEFEEELGVPHTFTSVTEEAIEEVGAFFAEWYRTHVRAYRIKESEVHTITEEDLG